MGLATAYWLARAGARPLLLEQEGCGAGATGRNGGFIALGTTESYRATITRFGRDAARDLLGLTLENRRLAGEVIGEEAIGCDLRPAGHLQLTLAPEQPEDHAQEAAWQREDGCETALLDRGAVEAEIPMPLSPRISGAIAVPGSALVHSGRLMRGLAEAARRRGARLLQAHAERIERAGDGVRVVTGSGSVTAPRGLVAVNAWIGALLPGLAERITPVRGQMLAYAPLASIFRSGMTAGLTETEEYWQQASDGTILVGGCRAVRADRDEDVLSRWPTDDVQQALERVLPALFPALAPLQVTHRWAGPMAFTRDRLPLIGPLAAVPACWVAGGFSGHGMALAFQLSRLVATALLGGRHDPRLSRFSLDRPVGATA